MDDHFPGRVRAKNASPAQRLLHEVRRHGRRHGGCDDLPGASVLDGAQVHPPGPRPQVGYVGDPHAIHLPRVPVSLDPVRDRMRARPRYRRHRTEPARADARKALTAHRGRHRLTIHHHPLTAKLGAHTQVPVRASGVHPYAAHRLIQAPTRPEAGEKMIPIPLLGRNPRVVPGSGHFQQAGHPGNRVPSLLRLHQRVLLTH